MSNASVHCYVMSKPEMVKGSGCAFAVHPPYVDGSLCLRLLCALSLVLLNPDYHIHI